MKKSFVMYQEWHTLFESMTDDQAGQLIKAIYNYQYGEESPPKEPLLFSIYKMLIERFKVDADKYQKVCEMRREYGKMGGIAKASKSYQKQAKATKSIANLADNDNDNDNDLLKRNIKEKPKKIKYGQYEKVMLTSDEYDKLVKEFGLTATHDAIAFLDSYIEEKGYKSKSHNLALRRWVFDAVREREQKQGRIQPKNSFNSFSNQNQYTPAEMSELERQLVDNIGG